MTRRESMVIVRRGRPFPGFQACANCEVFTGNADLVMVARPPATKGVWWCASCAESLRGVTDGNDGRCREPVQHTG